MSGPPVIKNEDNGKNRRIVATAPEVLRPFEGAVPALAKAVRWVPCRANQPVANELALSCAMFAGFSRRIT